MDTQDAHQVACGTEHADGTWWSDGAAEDDSQNTTRPRTTTWVLGEL